MVLADVRAPFGTHLRTRAIPSEYFGLHIHRAERNDGTNPQTVWPRETFGSWRLWDAAVSWPALEPERGQWEFNVLDGYVALAERNHVELLLPLGLSPPWAAARPLEPSAYRPGYASEPRDTADWRVYVRTVALRYRGRIRAYEIWNEPNLPRFYSGTTKQIVELTRIAHQELKAIDGSIVLVSPSATGRRGIAWLEEFVNQGGARWCDVIGFHAYVGQDEAPEEMARLIEEVRKRIDRSGLYLMPLWNTETGWQIRDLSSGSTGTVGPDALDQGVAAAFVGRSMLLGWIAGADRFYWYAWDNARMGLVLTDGQTETPAARAFGTISRWLTGAVIERHQCSRAGLHRVSLKLKDGRKGLAVWSEDARNASFPIPPGYRMCRDLNDRLTLPSTAEAPIPIGAQMLLFEE
jgi:hypothetical protein